MIEYLYSISFRVKGT